MAKNYAWNADDYARNASVQQTWARELAAKLALGGGEALLDIGCGDGKISAELASQVPAGRVLGVDSSAAMVELARASFAADNLSFERADARTLPYEGLFDAAFSNAALHWVREHPPVLEGVCRALKPGGRLVFQMGGAGNAADLVAVLDGLVGEARWQAYFSAFEFPYGFYGPEEYRPWLRAAGLEAVRVDLVAKDLSHPDPAGFEGWFRTTWLPYTERVPEGERPAFIEAAVSRYLAAFPPDGAGATHLGMVRLEVEARRPG